jgi:signal transduction histidine kinase
MRRLANEVLPPRGIELMFRTSGEQDASIAAVVRREVFLLFKEAITNIARHAECTTVDVLLRIDGRRLHLEVSDDGKGFDPTGGSGGQGLRSMRHRAELLGGTLDITSQPGHGTRLMLIVPFRPQARPARTRKDAGVGPA